MMKHLIAFTFILQLIHAKQLFSLLGESNRGDSCNDRLYLTCETVQLDLNTLLTERTVEFPEELSLTRSRIAESYLNESTSYTFDNPEEVAQAVFVHGFHDGVEFVAGSLNWGAAERHFKLEMCSNHASCFTWSEVNPKNWVSEGEPLESLFQEPLSKIDQERLDLGRLDTTTKVFVTVTVYTDQTFRNSFSSSAALVGFVNLVVAETNQGYLNSKVPIQMNLRCVLNTPSTDASDSPTVLANFLRASNRNFKTFRRASDVTVLLSNSYSDNCGIAYFNVLGNGQTLGTVSKGCATGYFSFAHEIGHMVGLHHNRETGAVNLPYPTGYGFLMRPPVKSGYRTILAYTAQGYSTRINYYSNPSVSYRNVPTGDAVTNNAKVLTERRFIMAGVGDESLQCTSTGK